MPGGLAPGFRDPGHHGQFGNAIYIGDFGYSWSSATNGIRGMDLNFSSQTLGASSSDYRAHGFQLRCLSE
ncbi:hypothetical protein [uncultured Rikenella sp.]|uniref:hypothetical protein n=1 Tax=uncultured Rikenella sp. TaxID=368003 RepID=UPI00272DA270|nr:hypothetical protein [uncultured Rikenella sp.]